MKSQCPEIKKLTGSYFKTADRLDEKSGIASHYGTL